METNQLTFEHICFKYKGNDNQLFTDLDVTMETGQVVGILGASGSGKTTLTEILLGQLKPTCQQFRILENGKPVTAGSRSWSYVPQQNLLREYLKVSETFDFYAAHHLKGSSELEALSRKMLSSFLVGKNAVYPLVSSFLALVLTLFWMNRLPAWMPLVTVISYEP